MSSFATQERGDWRRLDDPPWAERCEHNMVVTDLGDICLVFRNFLSVILSISLTRDLSHLTNDLTAAHRISLGKCTKKINNGQLPAAFSLSLS